MFPREKKNRSRNENTLKNDVRLLLIVEKSVHFQLCAQR